MRRYHSHAVAVILLTRRREMARRRYVASGNRPAQWERYERLWQQRCGHCNASGYHYGDCRLAGLEWFNGNGCPTWPKIKEAT